MPARLHPCAFALALLGAVSVLPAPTLAQSVGIDFGSSVGEDVLEGGGGIEAASPAWRERAPSRDVHRPHGLPSRAYDRRSSITYVPSRPRSTYYRGTGIFANANPVGGSVIHVGTPRPAPALGPSGPRIIDVEAERLDRAPVRSDGVSVTWVGSAKIMRLPAAAAAAAARDPAPAARTQTPALPYEVDPMEPSPAAPERSASADGFLEPWSDEWRRDCEVRHRSFDAALGTYIGADGRRRFCTGEPS